MKYLKKLLMVPLLFGTLILCFRFDVHASDAIGNGWDMRSDNALSASYGFGSFSSEEEYIEYIKLLKATDFYILEATRIETYVDGNSDADDHKNVISKLLVKNVLSCEVSGTDVIEKNDYIYVYDGAIYEEGVVHAPNYHKEEEMVKYVPLIFYVYKFSPENGIFIPSAPESYLWEYAVISPDTDLRSRCFTEEFSPSAYQELSNSDFLIYKAILGVACVFCACLVGAAVTWLIMKVKQKQ